jgi:hypothetical protein
LSLILFWNSELKCECNLVCFILAGKWNCVFFR